jgi:hypothetical protein
VPAAIDADGAATTEVGSALIGYAADVSLHRAVRLGPTKDALNRAKHGIGFDEASRVFAPGSRWLDMDDEVHSDDEIR